MLPVFEVDPNFPAMPDHMLLGGVGGATADSHGNVWVFHRPHTLEEDNATVNGYVPAPAVLEFSPTGRYLGGWGGPAKGAPYEWFNRGGLHSAFAECQSCTSERRRNGDGRPGSGEHGIAVDANDNVWLTGNGDGDGQILKFTKDGKFLLQIGKGGVSPDSNDAVPPEPRRPGSPSIRRPTRCSSPTATATAGSWCSMPIPAPTSATGAPMETRPTTRRRRRARRAARARAVQHAARHRHLQ